MNKKQNEKETNTEKIVTVYAADGSIGDIAEKELVNGQYVEDGILWTTKPQFVSRWIPDYGWHAIKGIVYLILIAFTVWLTDSSVPLWALILMPSWSHDDEETQEIKKEIEAIKRKVSMLQDRYY